MPTTRVARNLGRSVLCRYGTTDTVDFGFNAAHRVGANDQPAGGTMVVWARLITTTGASNRVICVLYSGNNWVYLRVPSAEGTDKENVLVECIRDSVTRVATATGFRYTAGKLHCFVTAWDANSIELWVDGEKVWSQATDGRPNFAATVQFIVGNTISASNPLAGEVGGEACLFARKLTAGEIQTHYYKGESPDSPVACWGPRGWLAYAVSGVVTLTNGAGNNGAVTNGQAMPERAELAGRQRGLGLGATRTSPSTAGQSAGWQVADTAALKPTSFSIECRVRFDNNAGGAGTNYRGIVVKTTGVAWNDGWGLVEISSVETRTIRMWVGSYGNGTTYVLSPSTREVHVVGTYDYVSGLAQMFVEGMLVHSWNAGAGLAQAAVPIRMMHGYTGANGYPLRGTLRDVRYYSRVLNAQEVELRAERHVDIENGLIEAWRLNEVPRQGWAAPVAATVAKGRIAGYDATWNNDVTAGDFEDTADAISTPKALSSRWLQANGLGSARTSAASAAFKPGTGSFSVACTIRLVDGRANTNIVLTANDGTSYVNGWAINFLINADGTFTLSAYVNSGGPTVSASGQGQRIIPRNKTARLVLVADASTGVVSIYADGKCFGRTAPGVAWNISANCFFAVGYDAAVGWGPGMTAGDVQYAVGKAWTPEEVWLDARGFDDSLSGVTHAWPMDETSGTSFRSTKGGITLATLTGTFADALSALLEAPRSQNLLKYSEQFNNAAWTKAAGIVCTDNAATAPDGSQTACSVDATAAGAATGLYQFATSQKDQSICRSVWVKGTVGQTISVLDPVSSTTTTTITFDGTWQRVKNLDPCQLHTLTGNCGIWIRKGTANVWQMWGAQVAEATALTPYVKTEAAVYTFGPPDAAPSVVDAFEQRCWLYTRAEDAVITSNAVSALPGRAPGARGWTQGTANKRPTLVNDGTGLDSKAYLLLDGVNDGMVAASVFGTDLSTTTGRADWLIAAVVHPTASSGSQAIFDSFDTSSSDRILVTQSGYATPGKASWYDGTWREPANSTTGPQLMVWDLRAGHGRFMRNGVPVGDVYPFSRRLMDDLAVALGMNFDGGSGFFVGRIYDIAIIKNPTEGDVIATHDYFRTRFPSLGVK
jgi:hypothetical protein